MLDIDEQLAGLATMSLAQLRQEWRRHHRDAPPDMTPQLLARGIAYAIQERRFGGLLTSTKRELERLGQREGKTSWAAPVIRVRAGTRLAREWHGRTHHVLVLDEGFLFEDRRYDSLTAIAREITGAAWSGPRFFGLHRKRGRD